MFQDSEENSQARIVPIFNRKRSFEENGTRGYNGTADRRANLSGMKPGNSSYTMRGGNSTNSLLPLDPTQPCYTGRGNETSKSVQFNPNRGSLTYSRGRGIPPISHMSMRGDMQQPGFMGDAGRSISGIRSERQMGNTTSNSSMWRDENFTSHGTRNTSKSLMNRSDPIASQTQGMDYRGRYTRIDMESADMYVSPAAEKDYQGASKIPQAARLAPKYGKQVGECQENENSVYSSDKNYFGANTTSANSKMTAQKVSTHIGDKSLRILTASVVDIKRCSMINKRAIPVIFEIYGAIDSAVSLVGKCSREFAIKDDTGRLDCIFHEIDRPLKKLTRGVMYRCMGSYNVQSNRLTCVSVRPLADNEAKLSQPMRDLTDKILVDISVASREM